MAEKYTQRASNPLQYVYVIGGHKGTKKYTAVIDGPVEDSILSKLALPTQAEFIHGMKKIKNGSFDQFKQYFDESGAPDSIKLYVLKHVPLTSLGLKADDQQELLESMTKTAFKNKTGELVGQGTAAKTGADGELIELVDLVDESLIDVVREDGKLPGKEFLDELTKIGVDAMEEKYMADYKLLVDRGVDASTRAKFFAETQESSKFFLDSIKITTLKLAKTKLENLKKETNDLNLDSATKTARITEIGEEISKLEAEIREIAVRTETYKKAAEARRKGSLASHSDALGVVLDEAETAEITRDKTRETNTRITHGVEKQEVVVKAVREVVKSLSEAELEELAKLVATGTKFSDEALAKATTDILEEREMPEELKSLLKGHEKGAVQTAAHKAFWDAVRERLGKGKQPGDAE